MPFARAITQLWRLPLEPTLHEALDGLAWRSPCTTCGQHRRLIEVNTVAFDVLDTAELVARYRGLLDCGASHVIHFLAAHPTVVARETIGYRRLLNSADLAVSDGAPISALMRIRDRRARRITSTDAFLTICETGCPQEIRHYFLGGANHEAARRFRAAVLLRYPPLAIAGFDVPPYRPYTDAELAHLAATIRASRADIVWIGLGSPKQDILAHRLRAVGAAPAIACIGATFDFVAGTKRRAPKLLRSLGLEWSFRLATEPRRLGRRYVVGNSRFILGVCRDSLASLRRRASKPTGVHGYRLFGRRSR